MTGIAEIRLVLVGLELVLALGLLLYHPVSARNAPEDPEAARDYIARTRRRRRYIGLYVLFMAAIQIPVLITHPS